MTCPLHVRRTSLTSATMIVLLKNRANPDQYEDHFEQTHFVPVLEHRIREEAVQHVRELLASEKYDGLIFTSQRAVDAFALIEKTNLPLYVVGPATARALRNLGYTNIHGEETGNGKALAKFILDHFKGNALLFMVGEQRRDIIPTTLSPHMTVDEVVVYETLEATSFQRDFQTALQLSPQYVVIFSPAGAKEISQVSPPTKVIAIGPTTRQYLVDHGFEPHATAPKPSPEGLELAIASLVS